jgi:hypothetical protein
MKAKSKFDWFYALGADERIANGDKFVLAYIAFKSASPHDLRVRVRQTTVAENCATSDRQVRRAIGVAKRCGYMALLTPRQRGRGYHGPDEYRLTIPENRTDTSSINGEIPDTYAGNTGHIRPGIPDGEQLADLQDCSLKGLYKGFKEGAARADAPPNPRCPKHINDNHPPNCHACGQARKAAEDFEARRVEAEKQARADALARRDNCTACDEFGFLLGPDGTSTNPAIRCNVHNQEAS